MSRASVLASGRAAAQAGMTDACAIMRTVATETDRLTGVVTPEQVEIYSGICRVQELFGFSRETNPSPDQQLLARYRVLQLPVEASEGIRVGDLVTITACVNDPDLIGVAMVVRDQSGKSEATSRRVGVEELTG